jgi:hypothetical protein
MYIILQDVVIILLAYYVAEYGHTWATGVWLVLLKTGPTCPHAPSRLILSLPSAGWTVYRHLHSLPSGTVWLSCPHLGTWLGIFNDTYVHTLLQNGYIQKQDLWRSHICNLSHRSCYWQGQGSSDLLLSTLSCRHNKYLTWNDHLTRLDLLESGMNE